MGPLACRKLLRGQPNSAVADDADADSATHRTSASASSLSEFLTTDLLEYSAAEQAPSPLLPALMLATATAVVLRGGPASAAVDALAAAAEDGNAWAALSALMVHGRLENGQERHMVGEVVLEVLAATALAFSLDVSALPTMHADHLVKLLDVVLSSDKLLALCALAPECCSIGC
jgi:hypothetical protein